MSNETKLKGVGVILEKDGNFLLQLRSNVVGIESPNKWGLFGGKVETGESATSAALREIKEELGILLKEESLKFFLTIRVAKNEDYTLFVSDFEFDNVDIVLGEGQAFGFFTMEQISKMPDLSTGLREAILLRQFYKL